MVLNFEGKAETGLHGLPMWFLWLRRIIRAFNYSFALTSMSFRDLSLLQDMIGGFLKIVFSIGWFSMSHQFSITICLSLFTAGWYVVTKGNILSAVLCFCDLRADCLESKLTSDRELSIYS